MIIRLICRASRRRSGQEATSKHDSTPPAAIERSWIQLRGSMETSIVDGEGGEDEEERSAG
eukprot:3610071-Pyramimonas_sp.AAC.1